jgi:uncharacterized protein involved in exopolysaccharide biosynthesis
MGVAVQKGPSEASDGQVIVDPPKVSSSADEFPLVVLLGTLYRQRVMIAVITGIGIAIGLVGAFFAPRVYVAQTRVVPAAYLATTPDVASLSGLRGAAAQFGLGIGGPAANVSPLFPQLLSSRELISRILARKFPLEDGRSTDLVQYLKIKPGDPERTLQIAVRSIREKLRCTYDTKSGVTTISASFRDPQLAAAVANAGTEELDRLFNELKTSQAGNKADFIANRIREVEAQLQQDESALKTFREQNRNLTGSPQLRLEEARLARTVAMNEQVFITLNTQMETARIEAVRDLPDIAIIEKATAPLPPANRIIVLIGTTLLFGFIAIVAALSLPQIDEFRRVIKRQKRTGSGSAPAA